MAQDPSQNDVEMDSEPIDHSAPLVEEDEDYDEEQKISVVRSTPAF